MIYINRNSFRGFTFVEILLALLIISIIASFSLPSYRKYIRKARINEAKAILIEYASYLNDYYNDNNSYNNSEGKYIDLSDLNDKEDINKISKYFSFSVKFDSNRGDFFILRADPKNDYRKKENKYLKINQYNNIFTCIDIDNKPKCE